MSGVGSERGKKAVQGHQRPGQRFQLGGGETRRNGFHQPLVKAAVGGIEKLVDPKTEGAALLQYLAYETDQIEKLLEEPKLLRTPIVTAVIVDKIATLIEWENKSLE